MKAYTDLEQSKKLAEILPLESADMEYLRLKETNATIGSVPFVKDESEVENSAYNAVYDRIPCWSLTALLDILPDRTCVYKKTCKDGRVKYKGVVKGCKELILKDNPIDACVKMILKLHEIKTI